VSDTGIAMTAALALFLVPVGDGRRALDWATAERMPWGVLILFGGGLSLAAAIQGSGLALWLGEAMGGLRALPVFVVILLVTTLITFLTEFTSNTATAAAFLPLASSLAVGIGVDPLLLVVPAALAASSGFMLPVGTPPNAIVFASGRLTIGQMARAGFALDLLMVVLITLVGYFVVVPALR
jgi:sodium-dependent dicarboxylate transporter 2/3/5